MERRSPSYPHAGPLSGRACQGSTSEGPHWEAQGQPAGCFPRTLANENSLPPPIGSPSFQVGRLLVSVFIFSSFFSCLPLLFPISILTPVSFTFFPLYDESCSHYCPRVEKARVVKPARQLTICI